MQATRTLSQPSTTSDSKAWLVPAVTVVLLVLLVLGSFLLYRSSLRSSQSIPGLRLGALAVGGLDRADLDRLLAQEAQRFGQRKLLLLAGDKTVQARRRGLGAKLDLTSTRGRLLAMGKSGDIWQDLVDRVNARRGRVILHPSVSLDTERALAYFVKLKESVDRQPYPAKLDLTNQQILPGAQGYLLQVYDTIANTELALRRGLTTVPLAVSVLQPKGGERYKDLDIGSIMGRFSTVYSQKDKDKDRAYNLKVGAGKLDGKVIRPGEQFSFNKTVGPRTEAEGYRMAPVISEGELVDGMAGGACQLSSTLFAASFFAGLELVSSRPHTRPSSYIKMGLDAAVAYPTTDLMLKNRYPFPVVMHFTVSQGRVTVRILGKKRPWSKVRFEREVTETVPFEEKIRQDPAIPSGIKVVTQLGVPGYRLIRRRLFFDGGKEPKQQEKRELYYPPTTQYVKIGAGPADPSWEAPRARSPWGEASKEYSLEQ